MTSLAQRLLFRLRHQWSLTRKVQTAWWKLCGARVGKGTLLNGVHMTWPHQVRIGSDSVVEHDVVFKFDGPWCAGPSIVIGDRVFIGSSTEFNIKLGVNVGNDCLIASGCRIVDSNHGYLRTDLPMNMQPGAPRSIEIEEDVWVGANSVILRGVRLGRGSIVGAGSVVTRDVPAYEIWCGVPARQMGSRLSKVDDGRSSLIE